MKSMNLRLEKCVGIGTDCCIVMLGNHGAVKELQKVATNAVMTPCYSHNLNRSLSVSSRILLLEKASSVIKEITFFSSKIHPKRNIVKNSRSTTCTIM